MSQTLINNNQEEWIKVLEKGMVTLPKKWREELKISAGDNIKVKKEGKRIIIESSKIRLAPYRIYTDTEIDEFLEEDKIPDNLSKKVKNKRTT